MKAPPTLVNPARRLVLLSLGLAVAGLALALSLAALGLIPVEASATIGAALALILGLFALWLRCFFVPQGDRNLDAFRKGDYLLHWSYQPKERLRYAEAEWRRFRESRWPWAQTAPWALLVGLATVAVGAWLWWSQPGGPDDPSGEYLTCLGAVIAFIGGLYVVLNWHFRSSLSKVADAYFGPAALYVPGRHDVWSALSMCGRGFNGLYLVPEDGGLFLHCEVDVRAPFWVLLMIRELPPFRVPVPAGHEEEARRFIQDARIAAQTAAIEEWPDDADAYLERGNAYAAKDETDRALADYAEAIRRGDLAEAYMKRAALYARLGDQGLARTDYARAADGWAEEIKQWADFPEFLAEAHLKRGDARAGAGDAERARADYERALAVSEEEARLDPDSAAACRGRGDANRRLGAEDKALADYDRAVRLDPTCAPAFLERGKMYARRGDRERAEADRRRALQLDPGLAEDE
jgi:tetratricopeptide (TPR) repeat protein